MKRSRFSEEQIIGILKEHEAGVSVADLRRKHGVSDVSIYNWKARVGGMDVSEARRCPPAAALPRRYWTVSRSGSDSARRRRTLLPPSWPTRSLLRSLQHAAANRRRALSPQSTST